MTAQILTGDCRVVLRTLKNVLGSMRSLEVIDYPGQGMVARSEWLTAA